MRKAFKARGRDIENGLHFLSKYSRGEKTGSEDVNVSFEDGRATIASAMVESQAKLGEFEFLWTAYDAPAPRQRDRPHHERLSMCTILVGLFGQTSEMPWR